jgi:hypothetical protein
MTRDEFEAQRRQLVCKDCGHEGLEPELNANNGGLRPVCSACGSKTPLAGQSWLPKAEPRRPRRGLVDVETIWSANGDHCAFCGKSRALCERLGIGLSAQHIVPFAEAGDAWPLVPFCARCQQQSTAAQAETRRVQATIGGLDAVIARIEKNHPELLG